MKLWLLFACLILSSFANQCVKEKNPFLKICSSGSIEKLFDKIKLNYNIMDGHDNAFDFWMKNIHLLKDKKMTLLHIDSRNSLTFKNSDSDLQICQGITKEMVFSKTAEEIRKLVSIEIQNFISPFITSGIIERVIWILPTFEEFYFPYSAKIDFGINPKTKKIESNSDHFMFSSNPNVTLTNITTVRRKFFFKIFHKIQLEIFSLKDEFLTKKLNITPENTLLNIDLDYFSVTSPQFKSLSEEFSKETVLRLINLFHPKNYCFKHDTFKRILGKYEFIASHETSALYGNFQKLSEIYLNRPLVKHFEFENVLKDSKNLKLFWCSKEFSFESLLEELHEMREYAQDYPDFYDDFFLIMSSPLHFSSYDEIMSSVKVLKTYLSTNGFGPEKLPLITTIAKSLTDGHSQHRKYQFILNQVMDMIYDLFVDPK
jgi:hypothetical protein